jgi:hypothetical protein
MTTRSRPGHYRPDPDLDAIISEQHRLINLAYQMPLAEADDDGGQVAVEVPGVAAGGAE